MLCNDVVFCSSYNHLFFDQPIPGEDLYVVVYGLSVNVSASHPSPSNWKDVWRGIVDWVEEL